MATHQDVVVVGGGVIGLAVAWRCAQRGWSVALADPAPGTGASHVAAGMLAPVTELQYGEEELLRLNLHAVRNYPSFVAELAELTGHDVGYRQTGTLAVATDPDDREVLRELHRFQQSLDLAAQWLSGRECHRLEPLLAPSVTGGLLVEGDHQVDGRRLVAALLAAGERAGVCVHRSRATVRCEGDRATGVRLDNGDVLGADTVVLAAGCGSARVEGVPAEALPPVRPVKGQILRASVLPELTPFLSHTVRGLVAGGHVYLVPREDGELVVGGTVEEKGWDTRVTAGAVYDLLRDAHAIVPALTELPLTETLAGLRPGSPDNAPVIGPSRLDGLLLATGHYRNGILLAPVTADAVAELIATGTLPEPARQFTVARFAPEEVPA